MTSISVRISPSNFGSSVLEGIAGEPDLVTDSMIKSINRWLNDGGNKKESYALSDIDNCIDWAMTGK